MKITINGFKLFLYVSIAMQFLFNGTMQAMGGRLPQLLRTGIVGRARPQRLPGVSPLGRPSGAWARLAAGALNEPYEASFVEQPALGVEAEPSASQQQFKEAREELLRQERSEQIAASRDAGRAEQPQAASSSAALRDAYFAEPFPAQAPASRVSMAEEQLIVPEPVITPPITPELVITPVVPEPVITQPAVIQPIIEQPVVPEPVVSQPTVQRVTPLVTQPIVPLRPQVSLPAPIGQRVVPAPVSVPIQVEPQPVVTQPIVIQPVVPQLVVQQPVAPQPIVTQPAAQQPVAIQPIIAQPIIQPPVIPQSIAPQFIAPQPVVQQPVVTQPVVIQPVVPQPIITPPVVQQRPSPYVSTPRSKEGGLARFIPREARTRMQQQVFQEFEAAGIPKGEARVASRAARYQAIGRQLIRDLQNEGTPFVLPSPVFVPRQALVPVTPQPRAIIPLGTPSAAAELSQGALVPVPLPQAAQASRAVVASGRRPVDRRPVDRRSVDRRLLARVQSGELEPAIVVQYNPAQFVQGGALQAGELVIHARNQEGLLDSLIIDLNVFDTAQLPPELRTMIDQLVTAREPATLGLYRPEQTRLLDVGAQEQAGQALVPRIAGAQPNLIEQLVEVMGDEQTMGLITHVQPHETTVPPVEAQQITYAAEPVRQPEIAPRPVQQPAVTEQPREPRAPAPYRQTYQRPDIGERPGLTQQMIRREPSQGPCVRVEPEGRVVRVPTVQVPRVHIPTIQIPAAQVPTVEVPTAEVPTAQTPTVPVPTPLQLDVSRMAERLLRDAESQAALAAEAARLQQLEMMRAQREQFEREHGRERARARSEARARLAREQAERNRLLEMLRRHRDAIYAALDANLPVAQTILDEIGRLSADIMRMLKVYNDHLRLLGYVPDWQNEQKNEAVRVRENMKVLIRRALNV